MAVRIDASGDGLTRTTGTPTTLTGATWTLMAWVYLVSTPTNNNYHALFGFDRTTGTLAYDFLYVKTVSNNPKLNLQVDNGSFTETNGATTLTAGTWYHLTLVRSSNTLLTAYLNGVSEQTNTTNQTSALTGFRIDIGRQGQFSDTCNARFAGFKWWDAALSAAEIQQEMRTLRPQRTQSLNTFLPILPGSGERTLDLSGNNRNFSEAGTLTDEDGPPVSWGAPVLIIPAQPAGATTLTRDVPASAALQSTLSRTAPASAALASTLARTAPASAALGATLTRTAPASAALSNTLSRTTPASAALSAVLARTVPASAALASTSTRTVPASAALSQVTDDLLSNPTVIGLGTAGPLDNLSPDGFTWAQAFPMQVDQFGNLVALAQDNAGNKNIDIVYSNDAGATWSSTNLSQGFLERGSFAIDASGMVHVLWKAVASSDGMIYRRYQLSYDGSNQITGATRDTAINLQLDFGADEYQHPVLLYVEAEDAILCVWSANNSGANQVRAAYRKLSNTSADNTAGNWIAPVSDDTVGSGQEPSVPYTIIDSNATHATYAAAALLPSGDAFIAWHESELAFQFRRLAWDSGAGDWSNAMGAITTIASDSNRSNTTDGGYGLKYQVLSKPVVKSDDTVWLGFSDWNDGDTWSFVRIDSDDTVSSIVTAYQSDAGDNAANNFVTGDLVYDETTDSVVAIYTDLPSHDIYVRAFDGTTHSETQAATLAWQTTDAADIPTTWHGPRYDNAGTDQLLILFRDFNGETPGSWAPPYDGFLVTMDWQAGPVTSERTVPASAALSATLTRDVPASAALSATLTRTTPASAALQSTLTRTAAASAALQSTLARTAAASAALASTLSRDVPTSAALSQQGSVERTVPASAALSAAAVTRAVPASAALQSTLVRTLPSSAALQSTLTREVPASAALVAALARTVPASAALSATLSRDAPASAAIVLREARTVPASAALQSTLARTVPASAALEGGATTPGRAAYHVTDGSTRSHYRITDGSARSDYRITDGAALTRYWIEEES